MRACLGEARAGPFGARGRTRTRAGHVEQRLAHARCRPPFSPSRTRRPLLSFPRPCPALACPFLLRSLALGADCAEGGRPSTRSHSCSSLGCARRRRALSVERARRALSLRRPLAPPLLPRRHATQQRALPRARLRALSASASTTLALSIVVVGDGAEKERRCRARRRPFPRRGLRSWTTPCALSCVLCWLVSTPCACAPGLNAINIATARRSTAHRPSSRCPLNARLGLRRVLLPVAFVVVRHEHAPFAHRHRPFSSYSASPVPAICINTVIAVESLRKPAAAFFVVSRGVLLHESTGRYAAVLRVALGASRCAPHRVLLLQSWQGAPHRRGLPGRTLLHALSARDGGLMPHRHSPARARRLRRLCARSTSRAGAARRRLLSSTRATRLSAPPPCPCPAPSTLPFGLERSPASVRPAAPRPFRRVLPCTARLHAVQHGDASSCCRTPASTPPCRDAQQLLSFPGLCQCLTPPWPSCSPCCAFCCMCRAPLLARACTTLNATSSHA